MVTFANVLSLALVNIRELSGDMHPHVFLYLLCQALLGSPGSPSLDSLKCWDERQVCATTPCSHLCSVPPECHPSRLGDICFTCPQRQLHESLTRNWPNLPGYWILHSEVSHARRQTHSAPERCFQTHHLGRGSPERES